MNNKLCCILVWGGKWPWFAMHFFRSCYENRNTCDYIIYSVEERELPFGMKLSNVKVKYFPMGEFIDSVSEKIGFQYGGTDRAGFFKFCDLKPFYGYVFKDDLKEYSHWAMIDMDVIFGDMNSFLLKCDTLGIKFEECDIIATKDYKLDGCLTILRNTEYMNKLIFLADNVEYKMSDTTLDYGMDEIELGEKILFREDVKTNIKRINILNSKIDSDCASNAGLIWKNGKLLNKQNDYEYFVYHIGIYKWNPSYRNSFISMDYNMDMWDLYKLEYHKNDIPEYNDETRRMDTYKDKYNKIGNWVYNE